ncbi:MAG: hypothetical protein WC683_13595 [bacterium]
MGANPQELDAEEQLPLEDAERWRRYKIMRTMHWTKWEYDRHPANFLDELYLFMATEERAEHDIEVERAKNGR